MDNLELDGRLVHERAGRVLLRSATGAIARIAWWADLHTKHELAQDVASRVLQHLNRKGRQLSDLTTSELRGVAAAVARRVACEYVRYRRRFVLVSADVFDMWASTSRHVGDHGDELGGGYLDGLFDALPYEDRLLVRLWIDGVDFRTIGAVLRIRPEAARMRWVRLKRLLRVLLVRGQHASKHTRSPPGNV